MGLGWWQSGSNRDTVHLSVTLLKHVYTQNYINIKGLQHTIVHKCSLPVTTATLRPLSQEAHCHTTPTVSGGPLPHYAHCLRRPTATLHPLSQESHCHTTPTVSGGPLPHYAHCLRRPTATLHPLPQESHCHTTPTVSGGPLPMHASYNT